jgi:hypothetical protein
MGVFVVSRDRARAFSSALRSRGLLRSAGPNVVRHRTQAAPGADPLTPQQWWRPAVVNPATPTPPVDPATSPKLGLVDSMPDLAHAEWAGSNFTSLGAGTPPETSVGHGTATASVAAAPVNGVGTRSDPLRRLGQGDRRRDPGRGEGGQHELWLALAL